MSEDRLLQGNELALVGGDIQQKIADLADVIFKMEADRLCDKVSDELALGAARLEAVSIPVNPGKASKKISLGISRARLLEKTKNAEREADEIMNALALRQSDLYKAEAAYICLGEELEKCREELRQIRKKYEGSAGELTARRMADLEMSEMVAIRYICVTKDRRQAIRTLCEGIASLRGNAYPLWKGAVMGAVEGVVGENFGRAEYLRLAIIEEMKKYAAAFGKNLFAESGGKGLFAEKGYNK